MSNCFNLHFEIMNDIEDNSQQKLQTIKENNPRDDKRDELKEKLSVFILCALHFV